MASQIDQNLFLSSWEPAMDINWLRAQRITHIVNLSQLPNQYPTQCKYLTIPINDLETENIAQYFSAASNFIHQALMSGGRVLVHCMAGISRSPTIVIAYLVQKRGMSLQNAFNLVQQRRPIISPNQGFVNQLNRYFGYANSR